MMQDVSKKLVLSSIEQEDGRPYDVATSTGGCVLREMVIDTGGWDEDAEGSDTAEEENPKGLKRGGGGIGVERKSLVKTKRQRGEQGSGSAHGAGDAAG